MPLQLLGGMAKGLAVMTMDQEFVNRFRVRPVTYRQRMLQGLQGAGVGIYEGITGAVPQACPLAAHTQHRPMTCLNAAENLSLEVAELPL